MKGKGRNGKPLAYITNRVHYFGNEFYVDERVYVPNFETESLLLEVIKYAKENGLSSGKFLDVGTGSGNNAIVLAKEFPQAEIIAIDISEEALEVAQKNIEAHGVKNITLIHSDLLSKVGVVPDIVFANLPWGDEDHLLHTNELTELMQMPLVAIFAPDGIVGCYVRLAKQIADKGWKTTLICETGILEEDEISQEFNTEIKWKYMNVPHSKFYYSVVKLDFD